MIQRVLSGRYELEEKIGSGGMAEVYKAHDRLLARPVAVKILHEAYRSDAEFIEKNLPAGKVLNLADKTTLRETEAIISQMDYYLGNVTGIMHMAAAAQIPVLTIYRGALDKDDYIPGVFSEAQRFPPWQTKAVILRPEHAIDECKNLKAFYGWCCHNEPHCIAQITPQEIIDGFETLEKL